MIIEFVLLLVGLSFLVKGADYLIDSATDIARHFGISELVIGLTLVSLGTSLPEFAVSSLAAFAGHAEISLGNVIGSNIYNIFIITALIGFLTRYHFKTIEILHRDIVWLLLTSVWVTLIAFSGVISREMGILFISLYLIYLVYLYNHNKKGSHIKEKNLTLKSYLIFILSLVLIYFGGRLTVTNAVIVAEFLGISKWVISATLIGAGTGFPETITSLVALKKRKLKMSVGNIIGSNIFNILIVLGASAVINPLIINFRENTISFLFALISAVFIALIAIKGSFHRKTAVIATLLYLTYLYLLFFWGF